MNKVIGIVVALAIVLYNVVFFVDEREKAILLEFLAEKGSWV